MSKENRVKGAKALKKQLQKKLKKIDKDSKASVVTGYTQKYAIYVHEIPRPAHSNGKWKYLEDPARRLKTELGRMIAASLKRGTPTITALTLAAIRLQRASQQEVPVLTGALKNSAFTRKEQG